MDERQPSKDRTDERQRSTDNLVLLIGFVVIVGIGIWLVNAMFDARRADECITQGRRNCGPIEIQRR